MQPSVYAALWMEEKAHKQEYNSKRFIFKTTLLCALKIRMIKLVVAHKQLARGLLIDTKMSYY